MDDVYKIVFSVIGFVIMIVGAFMKISHSMSDKFKYVHERIERKDDDTNARIDDVKRDYVRRVDLAVHLAPIQKAIELQAEKQDDFQKEIIQILKDK
ncbi:MAG: hypothetical protein COB24_08785 [Hyphomicrobiales bacterium]|nr:MAG: hypothetical protein COB24_08785 [Hyphomicrobiales bacterium]